MSRRPNQVLSSFIFPCNRGVRLGIPRDFQNIEGSGGVIGGDPHLYPVPV